MPRSITMPMTGSMVWYYATPTGNPPQAAVVVQTDTDGSVYDLFVLSKAGVSSVVTNVPFRLTGPPTSGAWCTNVRSGGEYTPGVTPPLQQMASAPGVAQDVAPPEEDEELVPAGRGGRGRGSHR